MHKKYKIIIAFGLISILIIASIGFYEILIAIEKNEELGTLGISNKILLETGATEQEVEEVINTYNQFALEFYRELALETDENIFFSPLSIYITLSMIYDGANNNTAGEIASLLNFPDDVSRRGSFAKVQNELNNRKCRCTLDLLNNIWIQEELNVKEEFIRIIEDYYFADIQRIDFSTDPENARQEINNWVLENTRGKIKELLPPNTIYKLTKVVFSNAIYFKGDWEYAFNKDDTFTNHFHINNNCTKNVSMMKISCDDYKDASFNLFYNDTLQVLELPYRGNTFSMLIFLPIEVNMSSYYPDMRSIFDFEQELEIEYYQKVISNLNSAEPDIYLPKFSFNSKTNLKDTLIEMGLEEAFSPSADFSKITEDCPLSIDEIYHETSISVNEEGTEASAATAGPMASCIPDMFNANHPFFFTIQDKETGLILFAGRLLDPNSD